MSTNDTVAHKKLFDQEKSSKIREERLETGLLFLSNSVCTTSSTPLFLIFGWAGGEEKYLKKYVEMLMGTFTCEAIVAKTELFGTMFSKAGEKAASKIMEALLDLNNAHPNRPVIFYSFSNGGCLLSTLVKMKIHEDDSERSSVNIRGSVLDSCPCQLTDTLFLNAVAASIGYESYSTFLKPIIWLILNILMLLLTNFVITKDSLLSNYYNTVATMACRSPELYLYSTKDKLVPYGDIKQLIKIRKELGVNVIVKEWDDTLHVQHFRGHKDEYTRLVTTFVENVI